VRDPARIEPTLQRIREVWQRNPDARLGQIIANVTTEDDVYFIEDEELINRVETLYHITGEKR